MKKLSDYIKYYIGKHCVIEGKLGWIITVDHEGGVVVRIIEGAGTKCVQAEYVKPILRPISDISKNEAKYILDNYSFRNVDMPMDKRLFGINIATRLAEQMDVANYLITQGFDLFGLIDAGLALTKEQAEQLIKS